MEERVVEDRTPQWGAVLYPKLVSLWKSGIGCDVTIVCQDGTVKAPSVLLCALSDKLHEVLLTCKDSTLNFLNVDYKFWDDLLSWVYAGTLPEQMLYQEQLPVLFSTLLVAHSLGMNEVLTLYKHLCQVGKTGTSVSTLWNSFDSDIKMDVQMQYLSTNDDLTSVCFTSAVMSELKDPLQCSPLQIEERCKIRGSHTITEEVCVCCEKNCQAEIVQCVYCQRILQRTDGLIHMQQDHAFCLSFLWPFSCQILDHEDKPVLKGCKMLAKTPKQKVAYKYTCKVCSLCCTNIMEFTDHFLLHGFFPKMCYCCGDVFSSEDMKNQHLQYCRLRTTEEESMASVVAHLYDSTTRHYQHENFDSETIGNPLKPQVTLREALETNLKREEFTKRCMACGEICAAKKVVCLYCNAVVPNDVTHMLTEHIECKKATVWEFTCDLERPENTEEIVKRVAVDQGAFLYECKICHQNIEQKEGIFFHIRNVHKITSLFHCQYCESGFKSSSLRSRHQFLCGGGRFLKCNRCQFYGSREDIRVHNEEIHLPQPVSVLKRKKVMTKQQKKPSVGGFKDRRGNEEREQDGSLCFSCQIHCPAIKVKCVYCFKVVPNDKSHMETDHPYASENAKWIYTCKYLARQIVKTKQWVLICKEPINPEDKSQYHYRCTKCNKTFHKLEKAKRHTKIAHHGYMKICKYCHMGFASFVHHKDHEHFCGGGGLIQCDICHRNVGCYRSLYDHQTKWHTEIEKKILKGKPIDNSDDEVYDGSQVEESEEEDDQPDEIQDQAYIEEATVTELHEIKEVISNKSACYYCGKNCKKKKVRCIYCGKVCENDISHKETHHPFTPKKSLWVYTCKFQMEASAPNKDWVVCAKEHVKGKGLSEHQYRCYKCDSLFPSLEEVMEHLDNSHNISPKVCGVCDTGFAKQDQMEDHNHFCNGGHLLTCDICNQYLGTYNLYLHHMSTVHPDYNEVEEDLAIGFDTKESNASGDQLKSVDRKSLCLDCGDVCKAAMVQCNYCYKIVENNKNHMDKQHMFSPYTCAWLYRCKFQSNKANESQKWMASAKEPIGHEDTGDNVSSHHRCSYCDICLPDLDSMLDHIKLDHSITHPVKVCDICDAVFLKFSYWKDHFHFCNGGDVLMCDTCGKVLGGYKALTEHQCPGNTTQILEASDIFDEGDLIAEDTNIIIKHEAAEEAAETFIQIEIDDGSKAVEEILPYFFDDKTLQVIAYPKRCFTCGDNCSSIMVKCMLCDKITLGADNHMEKDHPTMAEKVIWPVNCAYTEDELPSVHVSDVFFREVDGIENFDLKVYRCLVCQETSDTSMELSQHTQKEHQFVLHFCNVCNLGFDSDIKQKSHQHFCSGGDLLKCTLCDSLVGSWSMANNHYHSLHKIDDQEQGKKRKLDSSSSPNKKAKLKQEKLNDITGHDLEIPRGFDLKCIECDFQSPSMLEIDSHNKTTHGYKNNELGQICHFCFRIFKSRSNREKHEQHEHLGNQRVFCEKCGRDFEIPLQKEIHVKYYHKDE